MNIKEKIIGIRTLRLALVVASHDPRASEPYVMNKYIKDGSIPITGDDSVDDQLYATKMAALLGEIIKEFSV